MSNERQETIADIVAWLRRPREGENAYLTLWRDEIADLIEAAHKREVEELKHWIKSAARWIKCHDIYHTSGDDLIKQANEILNDDGEFLFKKGEQ